MEQSRAAIAAIHIRVKGELSALAEELEQSPEREEELQLKFNSLTNTAVWEALYTLADEIDGLRSSR